MRFGADTRYCVGLGVSNRWSMGAFRTYLTRVAHCAAQRVSVGQNEPVKNDIRIKVMRQIRKCRFSGSFSVQLFAPDVGSTETTVGGDHWPRGWPWSDFLRSF